MDIRIGNARFTATTAEVVVNGHRLHVDSKWSLIRDGLCNLQGGDESAALRRSLNDTLSPQDDSLILSSDWSLVEIAARYWRWSNDESNDPWTPCTVEPIRNREQARAAWQEHVTWIKSVM